MCNNKSSNDDAWCAVSYTHLDVYKRQEVKVPKGRKTELQAHAAKRGESVNGFINRAIDEQVKRDNTHEEE